MTEKIDSSETLPEDEVITRPKDKAAWIEAKYHEVTLPSGTLIKMKVPNLPMLAKTGQLPNNLIEAAVGVIQGTVDQITPEIVTQQADFYNKLVAIAVAEPELEESDVPEIPYEDVELIVEIATRQRDVDALGRHIAGLHKSEEWRSFRAKLAGQQAMEDF